MKEKDIFFPYTDIFMRIKILTNNPEIHNNILENPIGKLT